MTSIKLKYESIFVFLLSCIWTQKTIFAYFITLLRKIPLIGYEVYNYGVPIFMVIVSLMSFKYLKKNICTKDYLFYGAFVLTYVISFLLNEKNCEFLSSNAMYILFQVSIVYFIGLGIDKSDYIEVLHKMSILSIVAFLAYKGIYGYDPSNSSYMSEAYTILPHVCMVIYFMLKDHKIIDILLSIIGAILLLSFGTRGAILQLLLFVICYIVIFRKYKRKLLIVSIFILAAIIIFFTFHFWIEQLNKIVMSVGLSTRIIDMMSSGDIFASNGRNELHQVIFNAIRNHPLIGEGIGADRYYIGSYVHNILYEFWISFGIPFGTLIMSLLSIVIVKSLLVKEEEDLKEFKMILFMVAFFKLFMSSSYLQEPFFFMLIGMSICSLRKNKSRKI
ncbi:O-antigen ligase family protein [Clostridium paraputrificum]|uniref:O-antigen ligase family protein n=1 Tax=Clostridium paraputrificum TaxID=29363 RepID=UPI00232CE8F8|nr:O-antigen ligase family protein [Clostridium paraputrificum]MDB2074988.1 O-antigen ligase family protein [Clostridium paraputrificum]MDB2078229.1 O-antigen ligase family protein [Clostridium paraputrificum]